MTDAKTKLEQYFKSMSAAFKELQAESELLKRDHKLMLGWLTLLTKDEFVDDYQFAFKQTKKTARFLIEQLNHKEGA